MPSLAFILLLAYLLGSIPTSVVVARLARGIDIREFGSGNAGATNVVRVIGWRAGVVVGLIDVTKGFLAVWFVARLGLGAELAWDDPTVGMAAGIAAVAGHIWPAFARFRGGKGVATAAGALLAVHPVAALVCLPAFVVIVAATRFVSLASMTATVSFPIVLAGLRFSGRAVSTGSIGLAAVLAALILFAHRSNVRRLLAGTEPRFGRAGRAGSG